MKKFSKILSVALLVALVLSLGVANAFADDDPAYSITVENKNTNITIAGKTYTAYKLFDATYSGTGANAAVSYTVTADNYFYTTAATKAILDNYFTFTTASGDSTNIVVTPKADFDGEEDARALADALKPYFASATAAGSGTVPTGTEKVVIAVAGPGYYLVDGTAGNANGGSDVVAAVALTTARPTADIQPKADAPHVDKKITGVAGAGKKVSQDGKTGNGSVGDKVDYQLTSAVPDMNGYATYQFIFTDTMTKGLTFNDDIAVKIGDTVINSTESENATYFVKSFSTDTNGVTTITIEFKNFILQKANKGSAILITYSATINEEAVVKVENDVYLKYSRNPYDEHGGTPDEVLGETPHVKTIVYDTNLKLLKVDKQGNTLKGAKFKFEGNSSKVYILNQEIFEEDANGTYYRLKDGTYTETAANDATKDQYESTTVKYTKVTKIDKTNVSDTYVAEAWVKEDGTLTFDGIGEGTYTITELVAPEGYNLLATPIQVVVTFDYSTKTFTAKLKDATNNLTITDNVIQLNVENNKGTELPSTGGIGTTIFYVVGGVLVLAAIILLVTKKRMSE